MNARHDSPMPPAAAAALEARFALHVSALLSEQSETLPHDVTQRLRFARNQALERARLGREGDARRLGRKTPGLSGWGQGLWLRLGSVLPLVLLVAGLFLIQDRHDEAEIEVAADVDAALLADALPPAAYGDPGFVEYLKTPRN